MILVMKIIIGQYPLLLDVLKIMEGTNHHQLMIYLQDNNLLFDQFGCHTNRSTLQLLYWLLR